MDYKKTILSCADIFMSELSDKEKKVYQTIVNLIKLGSNSQIKGYMLDFIKLKNIDYNKIKNKDFEYVNSSIKVGSSDLEQQARAIFKKKFLKIDKKKQVLFWDEALKMFDSIRADQ